MIIDIWLSLWVRLFRSTWTELNSWDGGPIGLVVDMTRSFYNALAMEPVGALLGLVDVDMMHTVAVYMFTLLPIVIVVRLFFTAVSSLLPGGIS